MVASTQGRRARRESRLRRASGLKVAGRAAAEVEGLGMPRPLVARDLGAQRRQVPVHQRRGEDPRDEVAVGALLPAERVGDVDAGHADSEGDVVADRLADRFLQQFLEGLARRFEHEGVLHDIPVSLCVLAPREPDLVLAEWRVNDDRPCGVRIRSRGRRPRGSPRSRSRPRRVRAGGGGRGEFPRCAAGIRHHLHRSRKYLQSNRKRRFCGGFLIC